MYGPGSEFGRSSRISSASSTTSLRSVGFPGRIGWSRQKPDHRSDKRDEEVIDEWKKQDGRESKNAEAEVLGFFREVSGKPTIVWDGFPAHRGRTVKEYLAEGASQRLHLERLSGYAPDLNPDESVWSYLKNVELRNLCCRDLDHLKTELWGAKEWLRHKVEIIKSVFREVGLA